MAGFMLKFISARDGTRLRVGVFEPEKKSRRVCVLLTGHSEFIEKYYEVIGELNHRGLIVATFDWRGQGGSARALSNPMKSYVGDFAEYDIDLASVMEQVVAPLAPASPIVLGHSMGGHIALRALHQQPHLFRAAVLSAPMQAAVAGGVPPLVARLVSALYVRAGKRAAYAWGMAKHDPSHLTFDKQVLTRDAVRFTRMQDILKTHPAIKLGGATWGWVNAAYRSMKDQTATDYAAAIATPVLVVGAGRDRITHVQAARDFAARLPRGRYVEIENAEHELLMERDAIRARFWAAFDSFVDGL